MNSLLRGEGKIQLPLKKIKNMCNNIYLNYSNKAAEADISASHMQVL